MENRKNRIYDIIFICCIYLIANGIPFSFFIKNENVCFVCNSILLVSFIVFYFFYIKKYNFEKPSLEKLKYKHLLFIPFLIMPFSNFIYVIISNNLNNRIEVSFLTIIEGFINALLVATCEELLFRNIVVKEFSKSYSSLKTILFSSLIFGGVHLLNISSLASILPSIVQCFYSFFLGLLLSTMYLYSKNIILPIFLHFSFNFINDKLVTNMFDYSTNNLMYYIISLSIGIVIFIYLIFIYRILRKEEDSYVS